MAWTCIKNLFLLLIITSTLFIVTYLHGSVVESGTNVHSSDQWYNNVLSAALPNNYTTYQNSLTTVSTLTETVTTHTKATTRLIHVSSPLVGHEVLREKIFDFYKKREKPKQLLYYRNDRFISWHKDRPYKPTGWSRSTVQTSPSKIWKEIQSYTNVTRQRCVNLQKTDEKLHDIWRGGVLSSRFHYPIPVCWSLPKTEYCSLGL